MTVFGQRRWPRAATKAAFPTSPGERRMKALLALLGCLAAGSVCAADAPQYQLTVLRGLGGTSSIGNSINDRGWVAGRSNQSGNQSRHATLWRGGVLTDLQTLGGPNSAVLWPVKNVRGVVSGITQTG